MRGHANCWWGITSSALHAMLTSARFEVVEQRRIFPTPYFTEIIARPIAKDPMLPALSYYRERGDAREQSGERLPFDDYYEQTASR